MNLYRSIKYTSFYYILQICIYDVFRTFLCHSMNVEARGKNLGTGSLFPLLGPKDRAQVFRLVSRLLDALSYVSQKHSFICYYILLLVFLTCASNS